MPKTVPRLYMGEQYDKEAQEHLKRTIEFEEMAAKSDRTGRPRAIWRKSPPGTRSGNRIPATGNNRFRTGNSRIAKYQLRIQLKPSRPERHVSRPQPACHGRVRSGSSSPRLWPTLWPTLHLRCGAPLRYSCRKCQPINPCRIRWRNRRFSGLRSRNVSLTRSTDSRIRARRCIVGRRGGRRFPRPRCCAAWRACRRRFLNWASAPATAWRCLRRIARSGTSRISRFRGWAASPCPFISTSRPERLVYILNDSAARVVVAAGGDRAFSENCRMPREADGARAGDCGRCSRRSEGLMS